MNLARENKTFNKLRHSLRSGKYLTWESYHTFCHPAFFLYGVSAALSIALSQIILVAVILYWVVLQCTIGSAFKNSSASLRSHLMTYSVPVLCWITLAGLACVVGLDPMRSFLEFYKTALYMLLPFAVASTLCTVALTQDEALSRIFIYLRNLLLGSCLASIHTILSTARNAELPIGVPGGLTEAGQLVLFVPVVMYALFELGAHKRENRTTLLSAISFAVLLLIFAWPQVGAALYSDASFWLVQAVSGLLWLGIFVYAVRFFLRANPEQKESRALQLTALLAPLLFAAVLFNLKRGPWFAIIAELIVIGLLFSRRLMFASIGSSLLLITLVEPIRDRVSSLLDHFLIHGGRSSMWTLGAEMSGRFPLGVGLDNASYMRKLDPTMPETHLHMHSNFINVAVETGFLGLAVFLWWNILMIHLGFKLYKYSKQYSGDTHKRAGKLAVFIAIALIGWQISGLVEYNFGDGEIRLIVLFLMGILLGLTRFFKVEFDADNSPQATRRD